MAPEAPSEGRISFGEPDRVALSLAVEPNLRKADDVVAAIESATDLDARASARIRG